MSIYAIGDLHLSFGVNKPMDIFGWGDHANRIKQNWLENIKNEDTVVIAGDFSWALTLEEAKLDFAFINSLPGKKILLKGNHDYWWNSVTKLNNFLEQNGFNNIYFLYNNAYCIENKLLVGTRGWINDFSNSENYKILKRENQRLKLSIEYGINNYEDYNEIICFLHYPPFYKENVLSEIDYTSIMNKYGINRCFYAHLHGESHKDAIEGFYNNIQYSLISSDYLNFNIYKIL